MKSTITLYYKSLVNAEKNFVLDNGTSTSTIETYLATLTKETIVDFQYIKHKLSLSIKINKDQTNLEMVDSKDLNYCKIQNGSEKIYYYFIINKKWTGKDTIELVLTMDTLNTFRFNVDYVINKKTLVKRMHKDRFNRILSSLDKDVYVLSAYSEALTGETLVADKIGFMYGYGDSDTTIHYFYNVTFKLEFVSGGIVPIYHLTLENLENDLLNFLTYNETNQNLSLVEMRFEDKLYIIGDSKIIEFNKIYKPVVNIDFKSEDIMSPVYKVTEQDLAEKDKPLIEWSLLYKNSSNQASAPVDCFLLADTPSTITIVQPSTDGVLNSSNVPNGKWLLFYLTYPDGALTFQYGSNTYTLEPYNVYGENGVYIVAITNDNGTIKMNIGVFRDGYYLTYGQWQEVYSGSSIKILNAIQQVHAYQRDALFNGRNSEEVQDAIYTYSKSEFATTIIQLGAVIVDAVIEGKSSIDKSLSENIKLINTPYCPTPYEIDINGKYTFAPCWLYNSSDHKMKLIDFNRRFKNNIKTAVENPINIFRVDYVINPTENRKIKDTKLYHSDYYRPKFVYDSFSKIFPLEQIDYFKTLEQYDIRYFNEVLPFDFDFVMSRNIVSKFLFKFKFVYSHSSEDYPNVLAVARNNEEVLYSSQYLDYLRTGYNFDLKAKERQETASATGIGLSVLGLVATGVIGAVTGNPIAVGGAVASGISLANSLVNLSKTTAQNEDNLQRKLAETQRQAVSVLNADDYDLLYEYTNNIPKLCLYTISSNMEKVLDDLFYYVGYIVNEQMIPNVYSRYWFNFVQASLVINDSANLTTEIEDDLKEKFELGVTFLHYHSAFDFAQIKENWEISLIPNIGG